MAGGDVKERVDRLGGIVPPVPRLAWGLAILISVALSKGLTVLAVETACALVLALLSGKRPRLLTNALFLAAMTASSFLTPRGEVLVSIGTVPLVTRDALFDGLERGLMILCMVQVSGCSVSPDLRLPGSFGSLLSGVLARFHALMDMRGKVDKKDVMGSVDRILFKIYDPAKDDGVNAVKRVEPERGASGKIRGGRLIAGIAFMSMILAAAISAMVVSRGWLAARPGTVLSSPARTGTPRVP